MPSSEIPILAPTHPYHLQYPHLHSNLSRFGIHIPAGTQPGLVMRLQGKGLPVLNTARFGDHFITIQVEIPKKLSKAERKLLEEWRGMRG